MSTKILILILVSVCLSAFAQIALKYGMSSAEVQQSLREAVPAQILLSVSSSPGVIAGLAMYIASVGFWLLVLAEIDVSQAYPFVGLGFLLTATFAALFLGEVIGPARVAGTVLVALGVALVAHG